MNHKLEITYCLDYHGTNYLWTKGDQKRNVRFVATGGVKQVCLSESVNGPLGIQHV